MVCAVALLPDKLVNLLVSVDVRPRGELLPPVRIKGGLGEYLPSELDTLPHLMPGHGLLEDITMSHTPLTCPAHWIDS